MALNETVTSVMADNPPLGTAAAASEGQVKFKEKLEEGFRNLTHDIVLWGNGSLEGVDLKTIPGFGPENCTGDQADCGQTRHTYFAIFMCSLIFSVLRQATMQTGHLRWRKVAVGPSSKDPTPCAPG